MRSVDGDTVIAFNGEIFNHREIRAELEAEGLSFTTRCDTEVVLKAFLHWGTASFARLRGMFAIAIWVQSKRRLVLARDPMGIKPLYYYRHDEELYFGSELKCIFAHPDVPRNISMEGLNCYLCLNYVPGPFTLVEGIYKLMPGHLLEWELGETRIKSFRQQGHDAPFAAGKQTLDDACVELDGLLQSSIREQLVSDVPVGIWLSGGLDSSTILHYAADLYPGKLRTFSITFAGYSFDESRYIRQVSQAYGTQHTQLDLNPTLELAHAVEELAYYSDEPSADAGALPLWFLAKMSSQEVTVALSGEGSDELFGGYLTYRADRLASMVRKVPTALTRALLTGARRLSVSDEKISFEYKLKRFLQGSLLSPEAGHVFWNGTFSQEEKRRFFHYAEDGPLDSVLSEFPGSRLERNLRFDQRYYLPDDILYKVDRVSMAHSMEVRPPFLDSRIVDFAARLPASSKITALQSKVVLRRLMKDKLPASILSRPKIGFDIPVHEWLRGILRPLLLDTLSERAVSETRLFYWPAIEQLIEEHLENKANWGYHLWGLMTLLLWMKRWKIEGAARKKSVMQVGGQHQDHEVWL